MPCKDTSVVSGCQAKSVFVYVIVEWWRWSTCIEQWEGVAGGESERACVHESVRGYASLPSGSHTEIKDSFTQVEVACRRKCCVCVCFIRV